MVCPCLKVSQDDIERAIEDGASNFKEIKKRTKIVTKCGKCKNRAKCLIRELFAEKDLILEQEEGVCLGCQGDFFEPVEEIEEQEKEKTLEKKEISEKGHKEKKSEHKKTKEKEEKKIKEKNKKDKKEKNKDKKKKSRDKKEKKCKEKKDKKEKKA